MHTSSGSPQKFEFIEGARGQAAIQVVLLHYASAFLPAFAHVGTFSHYGWETKLSTTPVFFPINGNAAVFVFFLMSGFVLAPSFMNARLSIGRQVLKRFIRLFVPVAVSVVVAIVLVSLLPHENERALTLTKSTWAANLYANPMTLTALLKEGLLNSMLLGYQAASAFEQIPLVMHYFQVQPLTESLNAPLWTLHAEFWGSILTLFVARLYRKVPLPLLWAIFAAGMLVTGTSQFTMFLLGFAAYTCRNRLLKLRGLTTSICGVLFIGSGIFFGSSIDSQWFDLLLKSSSTYTWMQAASGVRLQNEIVAVLLLSGVMVNPHARRLLARQVPMWLGKVSFSVYLLHFPILFTVGYRFFLAVSPHATYATAVLLTSIICVSVTIASAVVFEKIVDRPAVVLARRTAELRGKRAIFHTTGC